MRWIVCTYALCSHVQACIQQLGSNRVMMITVMRCLKA